MELNTRSPQKPHTLLIGAIGLLLAVIVLYFSNTWTVRSARQNTDEAVHTVSDFYLRELAGRRGQVIASYLDGNIQNIYTAVAQLEEQDLSDLFHLMMFQARIERLYELERFAFVDTKGQIYTSFGIRKNIKEYRFHDRLLTAPDISVKDMESEDTTVVIAVPVSGISFEGETFVSCFIEIDIRRMLDSFSLQNDESSTTYCNLYYKNGLSLTDEVLSGRSDSRNLVEALREAEFSVGSSLEQLAADFEAGREGASAFTYRGITESVYYIPVKGTEWMLTYLIHDSMISEQINTISEGIILRSLMQTAVIAVIMLAVFGVIIWQNRRAGRLMLEKETSEALSRAKQQELEERLALQKQLLEQERQKHQSDAMITVNRTPSRGQ